jgi:hypothetical protein
MVAAKPINAFLLGNRQILTCHLPSGDPEAFREREFSFVAPGREPKRVRITGWSTASEPKKQVFDFQYTGERIEAFEIDEHCLITDAHPSELEFAAKPSRSAR